MAKSTKKQKGTKGKSKALSFPDKVKKALKKEDYSTAKTLCELDCKVFGSGTSFTLKKCNKCPKVVSVFCKEMVDGVYQETPVESEETVTPSSKSGDSEEKKTSPARNDQPYDLVLKELIKGTALKDIAIVIAGKVPTPKSFIGKVSCIYNAITGKSKARGVIYTGVKELKAGKKITKTGSSGYVGKVYEAFMELKIKPTKEPAKKAPKKSAKKAAAKKGKTDSKGSKDSNASKPEKGKKK